MRAVRPCPLKVALALLATLLIPSLGTAEDFVIVAEPGSPAREYADQIRIAGYSVVEVPVAEAESWTAADWSTHKVVWLLGTTPDSATVAPVHGWHELMKPDSNLSQFLRTGGILIITPPKAHNVAIDIGPGGVDFVPHPSEGYSPSTITRADHALVTGAGYQGVPLADSDLNLSPPSGSATGCWMGLNTGPDVTVIATEAHGPSLVEVTQEQGKVVMVAVHLGASGNLAANLIRYARYLAGQ